MNRKKIITLLLIVLPLLGVAGFLYLSVIQLYGFSVEFGTVSALDKVPSFGQVLSGIRTSGDTKFELEWHTRMYTIRTVSKSLKEDIYYDLDNFLDRSSGFFCAANNPQTRLYLAEYLEQRKREPMIATNQGANLPKGAFIDNTTGYQDSFVGNEVGYYGDIDLMVAFSFSFARGFIDLWYFEDTEYLLIKASWPARNNYNNNFIAQIPEMDFYGEE